MRTQLGPNEGLIEKAGSRWRLATPALVLDLDAFEANVAAMATWAAEAGIAIRPHAKTHKSPDVARRQIDAGAAGICAATLGEAEALAAGGIADILITSPIVTEDKAGRLATLNAGNGRIAVVADHGDAVDRLDVAAAAAGKPLDVLVELDVGQQRTGVGDAAAAVALARRIDSASSLRYAGIQGYTGHLQHIGNYTDRRDDVTVQMKKLEAVVAALGDAGLAPAVVTGGGTGTHFIDAQISVLNELQPGSYVCMDVEYDAIDFNDGRDPPFAPALSIQATVVSVNRQNCAIIDAGLKAFATDGPLPRVLSGATAGTVYAFKGDEHGALTYPATNETLALGATVSLAPPHCDPTVNLYDVIHCVRGDVLEAIWSVAGRGRT